MEYLNGGDLYSMLRNLGCLEEDMARVYVAELVHLSLSASFSVSSGGFYKVILFSMGFGRM